MRVFASLALVAGLMLGSTSAALASPEPEETETATEDMVESQEPGDDDTEDVEDSSPTPSPTPTATATPTETDPDPDLNSGEPDNGEETAPPTAGDVVVTCSNATVTAGQTQTVTCSTDPSDATLSVNSVSQIGGSLAPNGNQLVYSAPAEVATTRTDDFTVIATAPGGEEGRTQVTFTVEPAAGTTEPSPTSPQPTTTSPPDENETANPDGTDETEAGEEGNDSSTPESGFETADPAQTPTAAPGSISDQPTFAVQPPGAPTTVEEQTPAGSMMLPVPGMPGLIELIIPPSDGAVGSGPSAGAAFSAAALGGLAVALGASVLFTSRRLR